MIVIFLDRLAWTNIADQDQPARNLIRVNTFCHSVPIYWTHYFVFKPRCYIFKIMTTLFFIFIFFFFFRGGVGGRVLFFSVCVYVCVCFFFFSVVKLSRILKTSHPWSGITFYQGGLLLRWAKVFHGCLRSECTFVRNPFMDKSIRLYKSSEEFNIISSFQETACHSVCQHTLTFIYMTNQYGMRFTGNRLEVSYFRFSF